MIIIQTIITVLMCMVAIFFGLYLAVIVLTPFELIWRGWRHGDNSGFSFTPVVEMILIPLLILLSALSSGSAWYNHPLQVALWGFVAVIFAYGCFMVLTIFLSFVFNVLLYPSNNSKDGTAEHQTEDSGKDSSDKG